MADCASALPSSAEWIATPTSASSSTAVWVCCTPKRNRRSASVGTEKPASMNSPAHQSRWVSACGTTSSSTRPPIVISTKPSMNASICGRDVADRATSGPDPSPAMLAKSRAWLMTGTPTEHHRR